MSPTQKEPMAKEIRKTPPQYKEGAGQPDMVFGKTAR